MNTGVRAPKQRTKPHSPANSFMPNIRTEIKNALASRALPVLLNISLNRKGQPIVCTPKDAIEMSYCSGVEYLVWGNYLIRKKA